MPPRIKFDELITIDDWSGALRKFLDAAVKATENRDAQGRQDLMDLLLTFIKRSPAKVEVLDVIAREAIDDLALAEISVSLERISSRSAELNRAVGLIEAVTEEANKDARELRWRRRSTRWPKRKPRSMHCRRSKRRCRTQTRRCSTN